MKHQSAPRARRIPVVAEEPLIGGDRYDYSDAFEIRVREPDARSAEQFVRCALEQAPWPMRTTVWIAQRNLLRLRLGPRSSPDHLLGWKILRPAPARVVWKIAGPLHRRIATYLLEPAAAAVDRAESPAAAVHV
jgi:hypothetical protein